jgi:hypothetical protein
MACFQAFVSQSLLPATQLFRAKGFVWFEQQRSLHYIFHVSGKQRAECGATGKWQGPAGVQLVLIGQDQTVLSQLKQQLQDCTAAACPCARTGMQASGQQAEATAAQPAPELQKQCEPQSRASNTAAARFTQLLQDHHRFELWGQQQQAQQQQQQQQQPDVPEQTARQPVQQQGVGAAAAAVAGALVEFSALGSALHGVNAEEVRAVWHSMSACCFGRLGASTCNCDCDRLILQLRIL